MGIFKNFKSKPPDEEITNDSCEVIQVGIVCVTPSSTLNLYTLLKSLLYFRDNPIHFHIVVDQQTKQSLTKMFETWLLPQGKPKESIMIFKVLERWEK